LESPSGAYAYAEGRGISRAREDVGVYDGAWRRSGGLLICEFRSKATDSETIPVTVPK
jgi:hypothetical protein